MAGFISFGWMKFEPQLMKEVVVPVDGHRKAHRCYILFTPQERVHRVICSREFQ